MSSLPLVYRCANMLDHAIRSNPSKFYTRVPTSDVWEPWIPVSASGPWDRVVVAEENLVQAIRYLGEDENYEYRLIGLMHQDGTVKECQDGHEATMAALSDFADSGYLNLPARCY